MPTANFSESNASCVEEIPEGDMPEFSYLFAVLFGIPASMIICVTVIGNLLVLFFKAKVGKRQTMLLIWNLGLADFLVGIFVLPIGVAYVIRRRWPFSRWLCKLWTSCDVVFCTASIVTLCVISVDRYIGVTRPLRYKIIVTKSRIAVAIVLIWVFSIAILLVTNRYTGVQCYDPRICIVSNELQYVVHSVVSAFFVPAFITLLLYYKIYDVARKRELGLQQGMMMALGENFLASLGGGDSALRVHRGGASSVSKQQKVIRMHKSVAKTLGVVVSAFLFCWLPFFIMYIVNFHCDCVPHIILDILTWVGYINSALNPVIYAFTVDEFKQSLKQSFLVVRDFFLHRCSGKSTASVDDYTKCRTAGTSSNELNRSAPVGHTNGDSTAPATEEVRHSDDLSVPQPVGQPSDWSAKTYSVLISTQSTGV